MRIYETLLHGGQLMWVCSGFVTGVEVHWSCKRSVKFSGLEADDTQSALLEEGYVAESCGIH
jgi:hypothetical protein